MEPQEYSVGFTPAHAAGAMPAPAVSVLSLLGLPLNEWVYIVSLVVGLLTILSIGVDLYRKFRRSSKYGGK